MWFIYEIIHIWTAVADKSEEWPSQLIFQFKQLERGNLKKIRASTGFESVTYAMPVRWDFQASFQFLKFEIYCDDHSSLWSTPAVQIWIISYILHIKYDFVGHMWQQVFPFYKNTSLHTELYKSKNVVLKHLWQEKQLFEVKQWK